MTERVRLSRLVQVFGWTGLTSLGGGRSAYFYDAVVHKRPWLKSAEFIQDLTLSQLLPGPSFANLGVALGVRLGGGWRGGLWGLLALIVPGALILLGLTLLYFHVGFTTNATSAMHGMGAAVVGLVLTTTARMIRASIRGGGAIAIAGAIFVLVAMLKINTGLAVLVMVPLSLWLHRPRSES